MAPAELCVIHMPGARVSVRSNLARNPDRDGNGPMAEIGRSFRAMKSCKTLAISFLFFMFGAGCGMDKGSSGDIPPMNVFLEAEGCLADTPAPAQGGTILYSFNAPFDLSLLEARLEVLRGELDLAVGTELDVVAGTEKSPSDYFAFGRGPGAQKILVGTDSREPMMGRPWFVQLMSPFGIQEACEPGDDPDWRLSVRRSSGIVGRVLLDQEGAVPACTPGNCTPVQIPIEVPEDALSMEVALQSMEGGDADLLVGLGTERESLVSLNPGPGYDVVVIEQERLVPLRGQTINIRLESWQQPTEYRLEVAYTPGEEEEEAP